MFFVGLGRIFGLAGYPNIETIRISVIRLYAGYSALARYPAGYKISGIRNHPDIQYPAKKVSGPTLVFCCLGSAICWGPVCWTVRIIWNWFSQPLNTQFIHSTLTQGNCWIYSDLEASSDTWYLGWGGGSIITTFHFSFKKKASIMIKWFNFSFKKKKVKIYFRGFLLGGRWVVPFPKYVINLPRTSEKLNCKGEPYRSSG